jgi:hypothetical protein
MRCLETQKLSLLLTFQTALLRALSLSLSLSFPNLPSGSGKKTRYHFYVVVVEVTREFRWFSFFLVKDVLFCSTGLWFFLGDVIPLVLPSLQKPQFYFCLHLEENFHVIHVSTSVAAVIFVVHTHRG